MKTIVIYRSRSGFSKKYAEWIAEALKADIYKASEVTAGVLLPYDTIIYGAGLYAVGIDGIKFIRENLKNLRNKKVVVFATGASPPREEAISEVINSNFTKEEQQFIKCFYLRGGFDYNRLKPVDKILMILLKWKIKWKEKRKQVLSSDEKGMLFAFDKPLYFTKKKNIEELIAYVTSPSSE